MSAKKERDIKQQQRLADALGVALNTELSQRDGMDPVLVAEVFVSIAMTILYNRAGFDEPMAARLFKAVSDAAKRGLTEARKLS
jgi:hypothetical protein